MQTNAFNPQDWTRPLTGYRIAGWMVVVGLLCGSGAAPLLARASEPWMGWLPGLAGGLLVLVAGLYYMFRSAQRARALARRGVTDVLMADEQRPGRTLRVTAPPDPRHDPAAPASPGITAKRTPADPAEDMRQATVMIVLGVFILLPAAATPLLRLAEVAQPQRAAAYLGSPALLLWAVFEGLAFIAGWQQRVPGWPAVLGLACSGAQALAALLLWLSLGLAISVEWGNWLFWVAAGLALLGALAGTFQPAAHYETRIEAVVIPDDEIISSLETAEIIEPGAPSESELVPPMRAAFEVFQGKDGQFYFHLRAGNGEIILSSEGYQSKNVCREGVQSVRQNASIDGRFERCQTSDGKYSFILKAANHQVIGVSQRYATPAGREVGIQAVMRVASRAGAEEVE